MLASPFSLYYFLCVHITPRSYPQPSYSERSMSSFEKRSRYSLCYHRTSEDGQHQRVLWTFHYETVYPEAQEEKIRTPRASNIISSKIKRREILSKAYTNMNYSIGNNEMLRAGRCIIYRCVRTPPVNTLCLQPRALIVNNEWRSPWENHLRYRLCVCWTNCTLLETLYDSIQRSPLKRTEYTNRVVKKCECIPNAPA